MPLREEVAERIGLVAIDCRGGDMENVVGTNLQMPVVGSIGVRCPVLGVQRLVELGEHRRGIGKISEPCALQKLRLLAFPAVSIDQIAVHRAVLVGSGDVQVARLDGGCDMLEQEDLVERRAECSVITDQHRAIIPTQKSHRRA